MSTNDIKLDADYDTNIYTVESVEKYFESGGESEEDLPEEK